MIVVVKKLLLSELLGTGFQNFTQQSAISAQVDAFFQVNGQAFDDHVGCRFAVVIQIAAVIGYARRQLQEFFA